MTPYKDLSREELLKEKENLEQQFDRDKGQRIEAGYVQRKTLLPHSWKSVKWEMMECTGQQCRSGM